MLVGLTWRPESGHRGQQQIADAVAVHASATPETQRAHATALSKKKRLLFKVKKT